MKTQFAQKMSGERKAVMQEIGTIIGAEVNYTRAPRFAYEADAWSIDKEGVLLSPVIDMDSARPIRPEFYTDLVGKLGQRGFTAADDGTLQVAVYPDAYDPAHLENIRGILAGKATLLRHALGMDKALTAALVAKSVTGDILTEHELEGGFWFRFPPAMTSAGIIAALQLCERICAQAASQKQVRTKDVPVENEKYAMRCFLLRIGMIGDGYAVARKELLRRLPGNGSFKSGSPPAKGEAGAPAAEDTPAPASESVYGGLDSLEEALADAALIHELGRSFEDGTGSE